MSFNYHKGKHGDGNDSFWTSYSDLFLGMSVVFLLLYVTASLRTGTDGVHAKREIEGLQHKVGELERQLSVYQSKEDKASESASETEKRMYNELLDKLSLLNEEAKDERSKLQKRVKNLAEKEQALNEYQKMIRAIIGANMYKNEVIARRDTFIEKQDTTIDEQKAEIDQLETDVAAKQQQIAENEKQIADANTRLDQRLAQLKQAYRQKKMTEKAYKAQMEKVKADSEARLNQLHAANQEYQRELADAENQLGQVRNELAQTEGQLEATKGQLGKTSQQLAQTRGKAVALEGALGQAKGQIGQLAGELGQAKGKIGQLAGELGQAKGKIGSLAGELGQARGEVGKLSGKLGQAEGQIGQLKGDLARAKAEADARRQISKKIQEGFKKAGVKADVNERTGEVVINFGDVYFDNDSAKLKPQMKKVLEKAMPEYSKALFADDKLRDKITSVEIIGFASPTYQGKYVDPKSLDPNVRKAVDYNMDLSYKRARAIFQHIFDSERLNFNHQKDLLPLIKVTGRSFLAEKLSKSRNPSSKNYCDVHDCQKAQRVIIKFSFDDKK